MPAFRPRAAAGAVVLAALVATAVGGCSADPADTGRAGADPTSSAPASGSADHATAAWSYDGATGPERWGSLGDENRTCSAGTRQSPIDLPAAPPLGGGAGATASAEIDVDASAGAGRGSVVDNGHTVQFTPSDDDATTVTLDGVDHDLAQMHFHAPSEHTVDGKPAAAEFHFVHRAESGRLLVVGVLAVEGAASPAYEPFVQAASTAGTTARPVAIDLASALPSTSGASTYEGSLTTPPCTEGVRWVVAAEPITLSAGQIERLEAVHDHTARPTQPLGGRTVDGLTLRVDAD